MSTPKPRHPRSMVILFYTDMWELFGRFGIISILVFYLTQTFKFSDTYAYSIFGSFMALNYITPIFGGFFADRYLGHIRSIIFGASMMTIGNFLLVIQSQMDFYLGLAMVIVGNGFFLSSIAPLVGEIYEDQPVGRDGGFTLYYLAKNIGALVAPIACGFVGQHFGWNYGFALSGVGMLSGLIVFCSSHKRLERATEHSHRYNFPEKRVAGLPIKYIIYLGALAFIPLIDFILMKGIAGIVTAITSTVVIALVILMALRKPRTERNPIFLILLMMIVVVIFEAFLQQGGTSLNLFIQRNIDRNIFGILFPPSAFFALDPLFMLMIGPFVATLWMRLAAAKREPNVVSKFSLALLILALGFCVFIFAAHSAHHVARTSLFYVVGAYTIFPIAELCIIPIGLSLVTRLAPKDMSAMMVGVWMVANSIAGYFTGRISSIADVDVHNLQTAYLKSSALIYGHLFQLTAIVLAGSAVLLFILKPLLIKLDT